MGGHVRAATSGDAAAIAAIYAPYVAETAISFELVPPSAEVMTERLERTLAMFPFLVHDEDGRVLGYAYAGAHREREAYRWSADVSVYIASDAHRRGIGRNLYLELLSLLTRQGFHAAFAGIALPNPKSVGLHEALGFIPVGTYQEVGFKFGQWWDVGWWGRPLNDGLPEREPIPFPILSRGVA